MDEKKLDQQILEIYKQLPKIIQDAIMKSGWENILRNIVKKYGLRVDQGTQLENMTLALMMGQMSTEEYYDSIIKDFALGEDVSKSLFQDIDDQIFGNIEDVIQKLEMDQARQELEDQIPKKENYLKDDVDSATMEDKILTVTRDEILKGIEEPNILGDTNVKLPDLKDSNVMPVNEIPNPKSETSLENRETEIPQNLPINKTEQTQVQENKPVNPVDAGFSSRVSTSSKDYKSMDPYREPLE